MPLDEGFERWMRAGAEVLAQALVGSRAQQPVGGTRDDTGIGSHLRGASHRRGLPRKTPGT